MSSPSEPSLRNPDAVREVLRHACDRGGLLLLVTPYVRFESNFLRLDQDAVQVTASMSREDALFGLRHADLRMRFPHGREFFEAPTRLLGLGATRSRPSLALALPEVLNKDDYRASYRVERVGRLMATFSSRKYELLSANLVNLSLTGARIHALREFEEGEVAVEDLIHIAITVTPEIVINTRAKVRYVKDRVLGLEFRPGPEGDLLEALSGWVFRKQEEEAALLAGSREPVEAGHSSPALRPPGLVLVGGTGDLEARLRDLLKDLPPLTRLPAAAQPLKDLAAAGRTLALFHVASLSHEERKRARLLLEPLAGRVPFVLLGTDVDAGGLFELGSDVKAAGVYVLGAGAGGFFPRLLLGMLRKHFGDQTE